MECSRAGAQARARLPAPGAAPATPTPPRATITRSDRTPTAWGGQPGLGTPALAAQGAAARLNPKQTDHTPTPDPALPGHARARTAVTAHREPVRTTTSRPIET